MQKLPIGVQSFEVMCMQGFVYVDKTGGAFDWRWRGVGRSTQGKQVALGAGLDRNSPRRPDGRLATRQPGPDDLHH